jgi:peptidoglycan/LPS O-acetylase OafA/YrhL
MHRGQTRQILIVLLALLLALAVLVQGSQGFTPPTSLLHGLIWYGFLYGLPFLLGGLLMAGARWALMACVMYGTIGLALDIATAVQASSGEDPSPLVLTVSGVTGLANLALILLAGWSFLDVRDLGGAGPR